MTDTNLVTMLPNGELPLEEVLRRLRPTVKQIPGTRLDFVVGHETWYWDAVPREECVVAEIMVQRSQLDSDGEYDGCIWKVLILWRMVGEQGPWLQVKAFHESFAIFTEVPALFSVLAACPIDDPSPEYVKGVLQALGFNDCTERVNPHDEPRVEVCQTCERSLDGKWHLDEHGFAVRDRSVMNDDDHTYD